MFHTVYKITNNVNGKIYVGVHTTENLCDEYYGSGDQIMSAINKYGIENFSKEILHICETRKQAFEIESKIVDEEFVKRKDTYNMALGGGSSSMYGKSQTDNQKQRVSVALKGKKKTDQHIQNWKRSFLETIKSKDYVHPNNGLVRSEQTRKKISENHHDVSGTNNPMYGKSHSKKTIEKLKNAAMSRKKITCEHCGKNVDAPNHKRWHGDNCKRKNEIQ